MHVSVKFYTKFYVRAIEVHYERTHTVLPAKFEPINLLVL